MTYLKQINPVYIVPLTVSEQPVFTSPHSYFVFHYFNKHEGTEALLYKAY